jgi:3-hydroxybutyryl-CoA dehydratase
VDQPKWFDDVRVGDAVTLARTITEADGALYIAATGDFGPIHVDAEHARGTRFGERIAPGIMIGAMATSVLTSELLGPLGVSIEDTFRFRGPVRYGDTITLDVRIARKFDEKRVVEWTATAVNQRGETVLEVQALAKFPRRLADGEAPHPSAESPR